LLAVANKLSTSRPNVVWAIANVRPYVQYVPYFSDNVRRLYAYVILPFVN